MHSGLFSLVEQQYNQDFAAGNAQKAGVPSSVLRTCS
jgi:hypothetical protein